MSHKFSLQLSENDIEMSRLIDGELGRIRDTLQLIPSENFASRAVMEVTGSILTNKYAEGYPYKRYYEGNEFVDQIESLAIERAKTLFGAEYANVQPLSGGPANMCAYEAILQDGDTVLSLNLAQGGHLTHGATVNFSGKKYHFVHYNLDPVTHLINFDEVRALAQKEKPKLILAGYTAYPRMVDFTQFKTIADEVGALFMADISHIAGLIVGGVHQSAVPYADIVTSTTHKTLRGPRGALILAKAELGDAINKAVFPRIQAGPHMHSIAAKAVAFHEAMQPDFKEYAAQILKNAKVLSEELMNLGYDLVSGGTDTHLMIVDLRKKGITGKAAATALDEAGIVANKNLVPYDTASPFVTSGVRLGTPAMTTRGLKEKDMLQVAAWMDRVMRSVENTEEKMKVRGEIKEYLKAFPLYDYLG
ncbi:MAG: serine hydroxymethyltransferase [Candidatus Gracilibacteria bacterium]